MLGAGRERAGPTVEPAYSNAFAAILADPNHCMLVAEAGGTLLACLQLSFLPGLSHQGAWRAQLESVRVAATERGRSIGSRLVGHAIALARARGCRMVQLTTNKTRQDARRFYERLGFVATHEGMKLGLD